MTKAQQLSGTVGGYHGKSGTHFKGVGVSEGKIMNQEQTETTETPGPRVLRTAGEVERGGSG